MIDIRMCVCAAPISFQNDICLGLYTGKDSGHDRPLNAEEHK